MQHLAVSDLIVRAVRSAVCPICSERPAGSERLPNSVARSCEPECPVFRNLPKLRAVALRLEKDPGADCESLIRELVCERCAISGGAGEYCADFQARTCPLSRYAREAVGVIGRLSATQ